MTTLLKGFTYVTTAPLSPSSCGSRLGKSGLRKVLDAQEYVHIQVHFWYKSDQNIVGPVARMTPAVECCVVAKASEHFSLSKDPTQRHNIIIGPCKRAVSKDANGDPINVYEMPYLSANLCRK